MPIRPDLRHLYRTVEYQRARARVQERADDRCECCWKPNGLNVLTFTGYEGRLPVMFWSLSWPEIQWRDSNGSIVDTTTLYDKQVRMIHVVLTMAHLDHNPANNDLENLKFLCQWCHLHYDQLHHKETRSIRKDRQRPLLQA